MTDWATTIGVTASCVGALAAPFTWWIAKQQLVIAQAQMQSFGQLRINIIKNGIVYRKDDKEDIRTFTAQLRINGPGVRHQVSVSLQTKNGFNYLCKPIFELHAGSDPIEIDFGLKEDEIHTAMIGIQWVGTLSGRYAPHMLRMKIDDANHVEEWRWSRLALLFRDRRLRKNPNIVPKRRLGKWCRKPNQPYSEDEIPGWPIGEKSETVGELPPRPRSLWQ